jgi:phage gp46-like protein
MNSRLLTDLALAPLAGYVGTKVMEPVGAKLYELESEQDRKREDAARPGAPYAIAARKAADLAGLTLTQIRE